LKIHRSAIVHPDALLGKEVEIGPFSIIGKAVTLGDGTIIKNNVTVNRQYNHREKQYHSP